MTQYVVYQFDQITGFINGVNCADRESNDPFLTAPGHKAFISYLTATMTTTHPDRPTEVTTTVINGGGWSFQIDAQGNPALDAGGNVILVPPAWNTWSLTMHDMSVLGHLLAGNLKINTHFIGGMRQYLTGLARAMNKAGIALPNGVTLPADPIRTATSINASLIA